ncbi:uncharacterized protein BDW70DRAFT_164561 [Aspergillus foveolatus]|uniref:uncharacterized protein n=1 Tax=Aspergillus foveolatus TaxID=210207 RepID=UPI003CCD05C1
MPILSIPAISFAKISILCLYHQIFVTPQFRRWVLIVGSTVVAWMVACLLATSMRCLPPKALWDPSVQGRHIDFVLFFQCIEPINCLQDLIIGLMPIYPVQRLHLGRKQKVSLCLIFLLGAMVAVISLVRIIIVSTPSATPSTLYTSSEWLVIQLWLAILCANMLTYRPLLPDGSFTDSLANLVKNISSKWSLSSRESGGYELREPHSPWPPYASYSSVEGRSEHKAKAGPSRVSEQR